MKDSYSFDVDEAGLAKSYDAHRDAYIKIFDRLGFHYVIVQAMAGAMGGSKSEEFLATAANGEDTYVHCASCGYAANVEAVQVPTPTRSTTPVCRPPRSIDTPGTPTIETLVDFLNQAHPRGDRAWTAADTLKNVVVLLQHPDGRASPSSSACPATVRSTRSASPPRSSPLWSCRSTTRSSPSTPGWCAATSAPPLWAAESATGSATSPTRGCPSALPG
jgi:prolyl-tRNA synthetase